MMRATAFRYGKAALACAVAVVVALGALAPGASAGVANGGLPRAPADPLAGLPWGIYTGQLDGVYPAYQQLRGHDKALMARIALRPLTFWFGAWDSDATATAENFVSDQTHGNPGVLAQLAVFRLSPWEQESCTTVPGPAARASYRRWIDGFASGIGSSRVALILQPDLPFALCNTIPGGAGVWLGMVRYAAQRFSALPHTTVYIDAGAADWETVAQAVQLLTRAGVVYTRGFSLNDTHFDSTGNELRFGARIVQALSRAGVRGRHFVINTAANGSPFEYYQYHGKGDVPACGDTRSRICVTLGIPPTWRTADRRWGLSPQARAIASRYADAYLWEGRPWLDNGSYPFDLHRALSMAASTPY